MLEFVNKPLLITALITALDTLYFETNKETSQWHFSQVILPSCFKSLTFFTLLRAFCLT